MFVYIPFRRFFLLVFIIHNMSLDPLYTISLPVLYTVFAEVLFVVRRQRLWNLASNVLNQTPKTMKWNYPKRAEKFGGDINVLFYIAVVSESFCFMHTVLWLLHGQDRKGGGWILMWRKSSSSQANIDINWELSLKLFKCVCVHFVYYVVRS